MKTSHEFAQELLNRDELPIVFKSAYAALGEEWYLPACLREVTLNGPAGETLAYEITEEVWTECEGVEEEASGVKPTKRKKQVA